MHDWKTQTKQMIFDLFFYVQPERERTFLGQQTLGVVFPVSQ